MAVNPLSGNDLTYGYGAAVQDPTSQYVVAQRKYPAWMQDINAVGEGVGSADTTPSIPVTSIPQGQLTDTSTQAAAPVQTGQAGLVGQQQAATGGGEFSGPESSVGVGGIPGTGFGQAMSGAPAAFAGLGKGIMTALGIGGGGINADVSGGIGHEAGQASSEAGQAALEGNAKGGIITRNKLVGPDPKGPDNGFASIETGEGVLTRKALAHYGPGIVNKLNRLAVDKAAFR